MRSTLATLILGMSLVAGCEVGDTGGGGGGGGGGDDVQGTDAAVVETPRLSVSVDKPTISTELATTSMITVSLTGSGGFSGAVSLVGTVVDTAGVAIPGWTVGFNMTSVTLAANGTGSAVATVKVPSDSAAVSGQVKITATSTLGDMVTTSDVTALKQISINITKDAAGQCVYPTDPGLMTLNVKSGTKIRFVNKFTTGNVAIHAQEVKDAAGNPVAPLAFAHGPNNGNAPNLAYEVTPTEGQAQWYCHVPGLTVNNLKVIVVP